MCMRSALPHRTHVGFITNKKILQASVTIRPACMGVRYALPPPFKRELYYKQALISILSKPNLVLVRFGFSFSFVQIRIQF